MCCSTTNLPVLGSTVFLAPRVGLYSRRQRVAVDEDLAEEYRTRSAAWLGSTWCCFRSQERTPDRLRRSRSSRTGREPCPYLVGPGRMGARRTSEVGIRRARSLACARQWDANRNRRAVAGDCARTAVRVRAGSGNEQHALLGRGPWPGVSHACREHSVRGAIYAGAWLESGRVRPGGALPKAGPTDPGTSVSAGLLIDTLLGAVFASGSIASGSRRLHVALGRPPLVRPGSAV